MTYPWGRYADLDKNKKTLDIENLGGMFMNV